MTNNSFLSPGVLWGVVGVVVGIVLAFLYFTYVPGQGAADSSGTASSTTGVSGSAGSASSAAQAKTYTNFQYGYSVKYPGDAQNSVSRSEASFSFAGTGTTKGTLTINIASDITHTAYCLATPGESTQVATTTINGVAFHSYVAMKSPSDAAATTHYKVLRKSLSGPGNVCFDIQKTNSASVAVGTKLDTILRSLTFK